MTRSYWHISLDCVPILQCDEEQKIHNPSFAIDQSYIALCSMPTVFKPGLNTLKEPQTTLHQA